MITPLVVRRVAAMLLAVLAVPLLVAAVSFTDEVPVRVDEPAPRSVPATRFVSVTDEVATQEARDRASEGTEPVRVVDTLAQREIVATARAVFDEVAAARQPIEVTVTPSVTPSATTSPTDGETGAEATPTPTPSTTTRVPDAERQIEVIDQAVDVIGRTGIGELVELTNSELARTEAETVAIAQTLARRSITEENLDEIRDVDLRSEIAVRFFPGETAVTVVEPMLTEALRPTVIVDAEATAAARLRNAEAVEDIVRTWSRNDLIVVEGEVVNQLQIDALTELNLLGSAPARNLLRASMAMLLVALVVALYLRTMQPRVWDSGRRLLALSTAVTGYAVLAAGVTLLVDSAGASWWYAIPSGALAMLAAILVTPVAGIVTILPAVAILLLLGPGEAAPAVYAATLSLVSVPLVSNLTSRQDLRAATFRALLAYPLVAAVVALAFGDGDSLGIALAAGLVNGLGTVMVVQGALPALETVFRLPTVTALLDLADRNHPLLREVEAKALGTYNHSVMVAALVERACREIGADPLLGQVSALYHDVGKVVRPHFFIENQQGISNPHDDLPPETSARILHEHLTDGVQMARDHRLPPEVIDNIGSHHGTMLVGFFYSKALAVQEDAAAAGHDHEPVDECVFRYPGMRPVSKEAAILFMADSCEATTRAGAMRKGTLSRDEIETTVDNLIRERVDDGQFDACQLSFEEFGRVRVAIIEALVGIYHPRIQYPKGEDRTAHHA